MKTIKDFKIVNGTAILEGISYREEAFVVDEFLRENTNIQYVLLKTDDNRYFELIDKKLVPRNNEPFINPYFDLSSSGESSDNPQEIIDHKECDLILLINELRDEIHKSNNHFIEKINKILNVLKEEL